MVVAAALLSFGVSCLVGWVLCRRAVRRLGDSWEEWRYSEPIDARWAVPVGAATLIATLVGLCGFGASGALRAALLGTVVGYCAPFGLEGVRRYLRTGRVPAR